MSGVAAHSFAVDGAEVFSVLESVCIGQHSGCDRDSPSTLHAVLDCEAMATFAAAGFDD